MRTIDATFVVLVCLGPLSFAQVALADGSVGCLFNKALCKPKTEWCFDDNVFGRCVSYDGETDANFHHYNLNGDSLRLLKRELDRLLKLGYRWSHFYTQCVLKALMFALRYQKDYNENSCNVLSEDDAALSYFEENPEEMDPKSVGQVQFTPSVIDPHAEFADEIYIPVLGREDGLEDAVIPLESVRSQGDQNYVNDLRQALLIKEINKNKRARSNNRYEIFDGEEDMENDISPDYFAYLSEFPKETLDRLPDFKIFGPTKEKYNLADDFESDDRYAPESESRGYDKDDDLSLLENIFTSDRDILKSFSRNYNTPEKFRNGQETKDEVFYPKSSPVFRLNQPIDFYYPDERQFAYDNYNNPESEELIKNEEDDNGVYTEGGVVYLKKPRKGEPRDSIEELMNTYSNWGFKRPERLDVKKPGPFFSTNNYAFKKNKDKQEEIKEPKEGEEKEPTKSEPALTPKEKSSADNVLIQPEKKKVGSPMESPSLRRQTTTVQPLREKDLNKTDDEYAYITLKDRVNTWQEGSRIVRKVEDILNLRQNTFSNIRVDQNDVKFKVDPNRLNLNASEVVKRIEAMKDSIQRAIGVEVISTGIGNQNQMPTTMSLLGGDERQLWILSFLLCGIIAAVAIISAVFFVIKRHPHAREKIQNLTMDSEASKDYQDLCRARMASKTAQEKPEGNVTGHRVTNLAKEAEGSNHSPSSRSSTSSWSEEPALTNMDISTGHMVLSYMEDHLKNKDRLEQEWIALCAYEAEPCATTIATKPENENKNRYKDVLPYDHARVVLNELCNSAGCDYINASTITDHDPRNPAYIASQGPLPQTVADFWQMVWEQGSVVTVMLTRLSENGTVMCHRYWPDEGSELYHIYEVHLVSEHIWCDDYLVRSFYLKNVKTSETRTVTQFHFLSWPENGVPLSTKALLEFRRKVNKSYRGRSCPVVVHCSDGVGRTGTYCLIDMVLNRMAKGAKEIDIAATLEHIRDQRPLMVRTKQQFEFVLMAVAEEVHAILKALPANSNHSPPPIVKEKD